MVRALVAIINLIISVAVPLLISIKDPNPFSVGESYVLGVVLFIALTTFELYFMAERAFATETRVTKIWDARDLLDARLQEVRRLFHEVEEHKVGDPDLFVSYFNKKLIDLEKSLRDACSKNEVRINETMLEVTTWLLESSFRGRPTDVFRAVHFSEDNTFFFDVHSKRYFIQVRDLVTDKKISTVRRLIVFSDPSQLQGAQTQRLICFHQKTPLYECRAISYEVFMRIVRDYDLHYLVKDFGIYGTSYLYKGMVAQVEEIVGSYSRDATEIARFIDCFDTCWYAAAEPPGVATSDTISVDWLFAPEVPAHEQGSVD